jgi:hypothetical protein
LAPLVTRVVSALAALAFAACATGPPLRSAAPPFARAARPTPAEAAWAAARSGAGYLASAVGEDGRFVYRFDPGTGAERAGYNLVRHAGTVYAMLEVLAVEPEPKLRAATERALSYLALKVEPWPPASVGAAQAVVAEGDKIKLGGVALASLALSTHAAVTGDRCHLPAAQALGRYLTASIGPDGGFVHMRDRRSGAALGFVSSYYPGEALLALVRLHAVDGDEAWLDAAERGARHLVQVRDRGVADDALPHDHWLLYAFADLYRHRPNRLYRDHALRIARAIVRAQHRAPHDGAWDAEGRSAPAATRAEGLWAALPLALESDAQNGGDAAPAMAASAERAVAFLARAQIGPDHPHAARAAGGFMASMTNDVVRIDYVQHAISALLGYRRVLLADPAARPRPLPVAESSREADRAPR